MVEIIDPKGCPSGQAPAFTTEKTADPSAFVITKGETKTLELAVFGATCAGCISKIEGSLEKLPGITASRLNLSTGKLYVEWQGAKISPQMITETVSDLGYRVAPYDPQETETARTEEGKMLLRCLAVAGFAMANVMLLSVGVWASSSGEMGPGTRAMMHLFSAMIAIPAALYAGRPFFSSALAALKKGHANMDVPISLAVVLALGISLFEALNGGEETYFDAAVMLLFFLLIGRWLDHMLRGKAREAARDLLALQAVTANRLDQEGNVAAISARSIDIGDQLLIAPGDRIPVDGIIIKGISDMDLALVTGESAPVLRQTDQLVQAGTQNLSKPLTMRATATVETSLVADLARLIEAGQQSKSHYVRLADKAARAYVPIVHTLCALTFLGWFFIGDVGIRVALMNAIAVLIITCPCALGLATPAVQIVATGRLFKDGILVKTGDALERLAGVTAMFFDKTGTLTLGRLKLLNSDDIPADTLTAAAAVVRTSHHPMARAIIAVAGNGPVAEDIEETPGAGISGTYHGQHVRVGKASFVGGNATAMDEQGTYLRIGEAAPIALKVEDEIRADTPQVIQKLADAGIKTSILSGDKKPVVAKLAAAAGIKDWSAELSPEEKLDILHEAQAAGATTAMVGDGLNDAPSLAAADVSLSPGTAAQATQTAADLVFQGDSLSAIWKSWLMARRAQTHIKQNFAFAAAYNLVAAPLAMAGMVTPMIAALAMSGSSLIVTLNAMRLGLRKDGTQ